jgi:hypothetical protein
VIFPVFPKNATFRHVDVQATKHLSQDFQENKSGLTVHPPEVGLVSVKRAISNPSKRDMVAW